MTGENRETIISTGLLVPTSIEVDVSETNRRIYWVDRKKETVESANLDGSDRRIITRMAHSEFCDMALFRVYNLSLSLSVCLSVSLSLFDVFFRY